MTCEPCNGSGRLAYLGDSIPCVTCYGVGRVPDWRPCPTCGPTPGRTPMPYTFSEYQNQARETRIPTAEDLRYAVLGLASEAGEVAGKLAKALRDGSEIDETFLSEVGDVLWYAALIADLRGVSLESIARNNLVKLADRKARGKIGGSGDER